MIIEVSDDESNGSDMDIDDDQAPPGSSTIRQPLVSVPGFPPRQAPASAVSTPGPQTPATLARTGELSTKEQELAALKLTLKKKLAEQKRIKEAAGAATATTSAAAASTTAPQDTPSKPQQTTRPPPAVAPTLPVQASSSSGESSRDRKRRRRTEIQEQLPSLDDEIASNEAEMARLAKDLERLKANNERIMQDKQRLTKELEDLGIDTEGMSHADMQATKDEIERAKSPEVETVPESASHLSGSPAIAEAGNSATTPNHTEDTTATEPAPLPTSAPADTLSNPPQFGFLPGLSQAAPHVPARTVPDRAPQHMQEQSVLPAHSMQPASDPVKAVEAPDHVRTDDRASATPMDDDEDFYSPPPVEVGVESTVAHVPEPQIEPINATVPSPSEEGEVEMSESSEDEEEDYEPEEPVVDESIVEESASVIPVMEENATDTASQQVQLPEPPVEQSQSIGQSQVSTEDEEAYEPPDVNDEMTEVALPVDAAHPEPSSLGEADDGAMDIATSSSDSSDVSDSEAEGETQSDMEESESEVHVAQQDTNVADGLAPELQPGTSAVIIPPADQLQNASSSPTRTEDTADLIRCLSLRKNLSDPRSLLMKVPFACSSPIVTTPTFRRMSMAASCP